MANDSTDSNTPGGDTPSSDSPLGARPSSRPVKGIDARFEEAIDDLKVVAAREMAKERVNHTLQPTALVNEVYLRLAQSQGPQFNDQHHFFSVASTTLRRILVDHARSRSRLKRRGVKSTQRLALEAMDQIAHDTASNFSSEEIVAMENALDTLKASEPRLAKIVELRYFGGRTMEEIAKILNVSERTVYSDWQDARNLLGKLVKSIGCE